MASKTTKDTGIDVSSLKITDEPYKDGRSAVVSKYADFFPKVKMGQRIVCPPGKAGGMANLFRVWLQKNGVPHPVVKSKGRCEDGQGGVWWVASKPAEKAAPKTHWQQLKKAA